MTITMYTKDSCVQCDFTRREFLKLGVTVEEVNLSAEPERTHEVTDMGFTSVPVVIAGDDAWAGFKPDRVRGAAAQLQAA